MTMRDSRFIRRSIRRAGPQGRNFVIGIDLGQLSDQAAISIIEKVDRTYACRHLQAWPPGTMHTKVLDDTVALAKLLKEQVVDVDLSAGFDVTVAGPAILAMFEEQLKPLRVPTTAVTITGGSAVVNGTGRQVRVPKRDLASLLSALLEGRRLNIAQNMEHGDTLQREIEVFKVDKVTNNDTIDWRTREHDDLVLATAIACWIHEQRPPPMTSGHVDFYGRSA